MNEPWSAPCIILLRRLFYGTIKLAPLYRPIGDLTPLRAIDQIYRFPLREKAVQSLNRQLRSGIQDDALAELVINLYEEDKLCLVEETQKPQEPRIICSMGLV